MNTHNLKSRVACLVKLAIFTLPFSKHDKILNFKFSFTKFIYLKATAHTWGRRREGDREGRGGKEKVGKRQKEHSVSPPSCVYIFLKAHLVFSIIIFSLPSLPLSLPSFLPSFLFSLLYSTSSRQHCMHSFLICFLPLLVFSWN